MAYYVSHVFEKGAKSLQTFKKSITDKTDIEKIKIRLLSELSYLEKAIEELDCILDKQYSTYYDDNSRTLKAIKNMISVDIVTANGLTNKEQAFEIISHYKEITTLLNLDTLNRYDLKDNVNRLDNDLFDSSCEELDKYDCNAIMNSININREFNVFSARAKSGNTLKYIKDYNNGAHLYALEKDEQFLPKLKEICDRTIKGVLNGSRISNDVFDIMYLCPKISWQTSLTQIGTLADKTEKLMLKNHIKHLRKNGIFIFSIPFFRLTRDMCFLLSKQLTDIQVIRRSTNLQQIIIVGLKNTTKNVKEEEYEYLYNLNYEEIGYAFDKKYNLATGGIKEPDLFRGSALDHDEIKNLIKTSGLMESFFEKQEVCDDKQSARPLLPFNMGQIGLVLTSGCLDGLVEEFEGQYHAIKGMVTKIKHTDTDTNNDVENVLETISNKVQINIVTPNGDFIELA